MAKYVDTDEDIVKRFEDIHLHKSAIPEFIKFKLLSSDKQPHPMKLFKASELVNHLTGIDVIAIFNEEMFTQLDSIQQDIIIEEVLAPVYFDAEKDKLTLLPTDLNTFSGIVSKHGDQFFRTFECVKSLVEQFKMANKKPKTEKKK